MVCVVDKLHARVRDGWRERLSADNGRTLSLDEVFNIILRATGERVPRLRSSCWCCRALLADNRGRDASDEDGAERDERGPKMHHAESRDRSAKLLGH